MDSNDASETAVAPDDRYRVLVEGIVDYAIYMLDPQGRHPHVGARAH